MHITDTLPTRKYTPDNGDFEVVEKKTEVSINRYQTITLQNHEKCQEVKELRDILNVILGEDK